MGRRPFSSTKLSCFFTHTVCSCFASSIDPQMLWPSSGVAVVGRVCRKSRSVLCPRRTHGGCHTVQIDLSRTPFHCHVAEVADNPPCHRRRCHATRFPLCFVRRRLFTKSDSFRWPPGPNPTTARSKKKRGGVNVPFGRSRKCKRKCANANNRSSSQSKKWGSGKTKTMFKKHFSILA